MAKTETISSLDQLISEAFLQVDLRFCADLVENVCGELLVDPPKGIYHVGQLDPVMVDGKSYFYRSGTETLQVEDVNKIDSAVYDANGNCVIPTRYMRDKVKFLANTPLLPYRGILIAKAVAVHQINNFAAYHRSGARSFADAIRSHFRPEVPIEDELIELIENSCAMVRKELMLFLGDHVWNMFFTRRLGTVLRVERCMDWRAWEWEQKHGDDFRAGKYA